MNIKQAIAAVNQMCTDGVIQTYAIGGAVGATFYLEPMATEDVDVFIEVATEHAAHPLDPFGPVNRYLKARGHAFEGPYIIIAGWPVQFLPVTSPLVKEALDQAIEKDVDGIPARVFTAEHLAAIALETGRPKDKARLLLFLSSETLNPATFDGILKRHTLADKFVHFKKQFEL